MITIVASFMMISGCTKPAVSQDTIPAGKFVFIEHHIHTDGNLYEGKYAFGISIDFPMYYYNNKTKTLYPIETFNIKNNSNLIAVLGDGESLGGVAGEGAATSIVGHNSTPFDCQHGVKVLHIDANGTCDIMYNSKNITLKSGESWINQTSHTEEKEFTDPQTNTTGNVSINYTVTDSINNYGLLDNANITYHY